MGFESVLARLDGDAPGTRHAKLRAFQIILALVVCAEYWTKYLRRWGDLGADEIVAWAAVTVLAAAVVHGRQRRLAFAGIALVQTWYVWSLFPMAGNHRYLEVAFALALAVLDDEDGPEQVLLLRSLRTMVLVVLFYSGLQKLVHGYWLRGQFLAWSLWEDSFRTALQPLLSAEEFTRLISQGWSPGDGPYLVSSRPLVVLSNAVWLSEMTLAALLVPRVTRTFACVATCALIAGAELLAREMMFGIEFAAATLLFLPGDFLRRCVVPAAVLLAALVLVRLGLFPEVGFH
jgi:hypothetical protein